MTGTVMSSSLLVDKTNRLLEGWDGQALATRAFLSELHERAGGSQHGSMASQGALAKSTTENFTSYTSLSDGSTFDIDPTDLRKLEHDLAEYRMYAKERKFEWIEGSVKRKYLQRLLGQLDEDQGLVTQKDCERLEEHRVSRKLELKAKKVEAERVKQRILEAAKLIDARLNQHLQPALDEAKQLTRSIQDMEVQLAKLRSSRPQGECFTVEEANQTLDDQVTALQTLQQSLSASREAIAKRRAELVTKQRDVERLSVERSRTEKLELEARNAVKNKDKRIEDSCRQLADRTALLSELLGVKEVQAISDGELHVVYDLGSGKTATLALYSDAASHRLTGAKLLNSSISIADIVTPAILQNNVRQLVAEVLLRIA